MIQQIVETTAFDVWEDYTIDREISYLSVDPQSEESGMRLMMTVLSLDTNRLHYVDVLCQAGNFRLAILEATQVAYLMFPPTEFTITDAWEIELPVPF